MFDWWDSFVGTVGEDFTTIIDGMNGMWDELDQILNNLNTLIKSVNTYIWVSGIMLFVLFCMSCYLISSNKKLKAQNEKILELLQPASKEPKEGELGNGTNDKCSNEGNNSSC